MHGVEIKRLKGHQILDVMTDLARLRLAVFREYPYLYDGNMDSEKKYLNTYSESEESVLVVAIAADTIVGASTAIPLTAETPACQKPFLENKLPLGEIFYFGESVLLPQYRNRGIYRHFFQQREMAAQEYGCKIATFCGVIRDEEDKRKPKNYSPLDSIWRHFGYEKHPGLLTHYQWQEIGEAQASDKPMVFWMKNL